MSPAYLVLLSAVVIGSLGSIHLLWTFRGPRFDPRDPELKKAMERSSPVLTSQTSMWRAWIGFNGSHSIGAILFALVYGYLALAREELLFDSPFLLGVGGATLAGYLILAHRYWFSSPRRGITVASLLYVAGVLLELVQRRS